MKTKREIILETKAAFSAPNSRAMQDGNCRYLTKDGKRCALGRVLLSTDPEMEGFSLNSFMGKYRIGAIPFSDDLLKPEYRGHDPAFWEALQAWHDSETNFDFEGISAKGEDVIERLLEKWAKNEENPKTE